MKKVTREFIKTRQKYTGDFLIKQIEYVRRVGGGEINKCYENAYQVKSQMGNGCIMMSGWLVEPYNAKVNCTAIIQHWWNADKNENHFDSTPHIVDGSEYVQDFALYQYCIENDDKLKSHVCNSLMYQEGKFSLLYDVENMEFEKLDELTTEKLYAYNLI